MDRSALLAAPLLRVRKFHAKGPRRNAQSHKPDRKGGRKALSRKFLRIALIAILVSLVSLSAFFIHSYRSYAKLVDARLVHGYLTSRSGVYAAPRTLRVGQKLSSAGLAAALRRAGYVESEETTEVWNGSFMVRENAIEIRPNGDRVPTVVRVAFDSAGRIAELLGDEVTLDSFTLAPESLTNDMSTKGAVRRQLSFNDLPPVLVHAITSIEDRRFFEHHGLDLFGVARALMRNAGEDRIGQGGSSITQQLVKNTYLTPERTLRRKYAEAMLAFSLERRLSKADILALYCNEIYLGQRGVLAVRGVDQGARVFFGKELKDLSLAEAATLAGMIQSPARYSPVRHNEEARMRRNTVLGTMVRDGHITLAQAAEAAKEPLVVAEFDPAKESAAPYFIDYVNRVAERGTSLPPDDRAQDAHSTITTLDLDLQQLATEAIKKQLARLDEVYKPKGLTPQAALVALDPRTGEVLAMVGGRDYGESQLNRVTDAQRQPGSVFKPFVYAAALESGMSPLAKFTDAPQEFTYDRTMKYRPANYGGGFSMNEVSLHTALIKSLNVVTVDVAMQTGVARVANTAQSFGLPRPVPYPAIALGTSEATPLQIAAAYAAFANGGKRVNPQVTHRNADAQAGEQIIQPSTAFMITDMLEGVIDHGTARAARGAIKKTALAGKTGTSRDGWFVGYTPNLVCAVWIGFDDNTQLGLTGAEAALPAWVDFMKTAVDLRPELGGKSFDQPEGISFVEVDPETNQLATSVCPQHERVAILATESSVSECYRHNVYLYSGSDAPIDDTPSVAKVERLRLPNKRQTLELNHFKDTRVDVDRDGKRTLVNEMKASGR
jgi:penicillin-binding protein 1B